MTRITGLLLLIVFLSGCITREKCNNKFPPTLSDSIRTWITSRCEYDTVFVPYQELVFDTTGVIPDNIIFHKEIKENHLTGTIDIKGGQLKFKCAEDSLRAVIEYMAKDFNMYQMRVETRSILIRDNWFYFWKYNAITVDILLLIIILLLIFLK